ncbi:hypothetical protein EUX98_g4415 [Antrodiella citrinella]|uniref:DNA repair metallo-beta-lactamase domain-containing protein n=1 Tax=Antrodiella citrinella TaxID=2447956 RepID=A0A4S4MU82_9APHY|nr:hypothetical protein EUX98_g4415 [Antrodiella citrinella]
MAKKRKESAQSSTLLDFFGKPGGANKKPRVTKKIPLKCEPVDPADIIVIDTDDDEGASNGVIDIASSSDIEFVEGPSVFRKPAKSQTKPRDEHRPRQRNATHPSGSAVMEEPFGTPSILLSEHAATNGLSTADNGFGQPYLLVSPATPSISLLDSTHAVESSLPSVSPQLPPTDAAISSDTVLADSAAEDDQWETGDDETEHIAAGSALDRDVYEEDEVGMGLVDEEPGAAEVPISLCPVCGIALLETMGDLHIEEHVNQCLETQSATEAALKSLRPLSSLRAPQNPSGQVFTSKDKGKAKAARSSDAFSMLMTSHKENEAWKEATIAEDRNFRPTKGNGGRRKAPFYKVMTGMPIAVDAFRHAHSDHYTNLSSNWKSGPIYCSEGTANLIIHMLAVDPKWVHPLPMDVPTLIPDTGGVHVTLIEANHCPGSSLFLYEGPQTVNAGDSTYKSAFVGSKRTFRYLHCGDFRASPQHVSHPAIKGKRIDTVYLDTTYLDPRYCFPSQPEVISACAELSRRLVKREAVAGSSGEGKVKTVDKWFAVQEKPKDKEHPKNGSKTLIVVGTYSIGKERVVKAVAKALNTKVYCDARKAAILRCQSDPELHALLTTDPYNAGVHLVPLGTVATDRLKIYIERWKGHFDHVIGFRPTGWTYTPTNGTDLVPTIPSVIARSQSRTFTYANLSPMKNSTSTLTVYGVPYSEHSSFFELTCFALSFDWGRMIATVNVGSESSRGKMAKWVERWEAERKKRGKIEIVPHRAPEYW